MDRLERFHPLNNKWSLWYDDYREYMSSKEYNKNLFLISSFDTVEEFWCTHRNCPNITDIPEKTSFHLFKYPIKP